MPSWFDAVTWTTLPARSQFSLYGMLERLAFGDLFIIRPRLGFIIVVREVTVKIVHMRVIQLCAALAKYALVR